MRTVRGLIGPVALSALTVGLAVGAPGPNWERPAMGAEDVFARMGVQRPANLDLAPDLELSSLDGRTVRIKDFRGKVVLLGFFSTT